MRAFLLVTACLLLSSAHGAEVEVTVDGIDEVKGTLLVGFFTNAEDFRHNEIEQSPEIEIVDATQFVAEGRMVAVAKDLPPGKYAVAVVWDWNKNGELDTSGPFKVPKEPYGFSMNPKLKFGPPKFEECVFEVTEEGGKLHVILTK
jgi:uncharacterized protein (DUF2141 family)